MVLNMADFVKFWKSLQTLWSGSKIPQNCIFTASTTLSVDLGWIRRGRKLADFQQKAWAIAHGFGHGRFWQVLEIAPHSLKRFQNPPKLIFISLRDSLFRFRVNSQGSKIGRFWAKTLGYSPWFWTLRFWQVPEIAPNSLKWFQNTPKLYFHCFDDSLCRFRVN